MHFHQTTLSNGLDVVAEVNPKAKSVAAGFFVKAGSRDETPDVSGVSHFLEHMAFKGNERYSADDVNRIFDEIGADYNASTGEEVTTYYAAVLPEHLPTAFELLSTLVRPTLRQEDFDLEKNVILEEIGMYDDQPAFLAYDKAMAAHFAGHPLGRSILGSNESISALTADAMRKYHAGQYVGGNITLAIAGNVGWDEIQALAGRYCDAIPEGDLEREVEEARPVGGTTVLTRDNTTQQYVMQMAPAPSAESPLRFAAELLSVVVGDDSGSRLYWDIVDPGHAEAAELGFNEYDGSGSWLTFLAGTPEETTANLDRIAAIYEKINAEGISEKELEQAKNKALSRVVLRSERPMGRLSSLGSNWVYRKSYESVDADLEAVKRVTTHDVRDLLSVYPLKQLTTVAIGPLDELQWQAS
ncbi:M16 family metallopeptidase [Stratiformator vulcanicus]|uniref:Protease 3 n=1 Tax=Stratiformator vulcanicus TaxID=2527980 RepID=A0A517QY26_9PLAN|nr:pitrilysin family protein [Stratiformator vulcanicus]QDT36551.1 Protease 3 precursor [Stratiformator vulcanicus]